jgi:hypothetical protein
VELLETYAEIMSEAQRYRLEYNVDDMRMDRLFRLQAQLQEEKEQIDHSELRYPVLRYTLAGTVSWTFPRRVVIISSSKAILPRCTER